MDMLLLAVLGVFPTLLIVAGLYDLTTMKIPNWISLVLIAFFFPAAFLVHLSPTDMAIHFGVAFAALLIGMGMFALNWIGGGDAKLLAASCLWMGWTGGPAFLLWTAIIGGLFCLLLIGARQYFPMVASRPMPVWLVRLMEPRGDIPYGVAIAAGALMALPEGALFAAFAAGR